VRERGLRSWLKIEWRDLIDHPPHVIPTHHPLYHRPMGVTAKVLHIIASSSISYTYGCEGKWTAHNCSRKTRAKFLSRKEAEIREQRVESTSHRAESRDHSKDMGWSNGINACITTAIEHMSTKRGRIWNIAYGRGQRGERRQEKAESRNQCLESREESAEMREQQGKGTE
jgi:hypothetical protein